MSALYPEDGSPTTLRGLPMLDAILDHVEEHPETWHQGYWATKKRHCGTALCVGGHAVVAAGFELHFLGGDIETSACVVDVNQIDAISLVAARLLELRGLMLREDDDGEPVWADNVLFSAGNQLHHLKRIRDEIAAKLGESLRYAEAVSRG